MYTTGEDSQITLHLPVHIYLTMSSTIIGTCKSPVRKPEYIAYNLNRLALINCSCVSKYGNVPLPSKHYYSLWPCTDATL